MTTKTTLKNMHNKSRKDKKGVRCPHIFAKKYKREFYCPDCGLCMKIEIKEGKKIGYSWYSEPESLGLPRIYVN